MCIFKKSFLATVMIVGGISLTGCIEDDGTIETGNNTSNLPPPDFYIPPAPPAPPVPQPPPPPEQGDDEIFQEGGLYVVNDVTKTRLPSVQLRIDPSFFHNMRVGFDPNCENGDWVPIQELFDFTLLPNQLNEITAMLADSEGARSDCFKVTVMHDDQGPQIVFKRYPAPVLEAGAAPEIEYEIIDASVVTAAQCGLNGNMKACPASSAVVSLTPLPEGDYSFSVAARDELGNQSQLSVSWRVESSTRHLIQSFSLDEYRKVDVLIVIDNSGSMEYEQRNMAQRVSNFISILRGLDWQIGVTTTDPRNVTLGDGRLVPIHGTKNQYIFDSSMDEDQAQNLLGLTLQRPETGSGTEQGILATYRVIERALADASSPHRQLFRDGAQFATLLISDEDESANGKKNDPHNLIKLVSDAFGGQKSFSFHSIITKPGDTACRATDGYAYGDRYKLMSELTGGVIGSVCEMDYGAQLNAIAEGVRDLLKTLTLQCEPLPMFPIIVSHQGQPYAGNFTIEGVNLRFEQELPPGEFTVDYRCLR